MAAVALQRELDAYNDAFDKYRQQARHYVAQAKQHNAALDAYKNSFYQNEAGEPTAFRKSRGGYYQGNTYINYQAANQQYNPVDFGGGYYGLQYKDKPVAKPGEFTMQQPVSPGPAPSATAAQMAGLNQPSLTDIERNSDRGLISSAFNY